MKKLSFAAGASMLAFGQSVFAAIDTTAVGTAVTAATTQGEAVGTLVVGAIAALAVIGVIISVVRKL